MNIAGLLERVVRVHATRPAIAIGKEPYCNYDELGRRVAVLAGRLLTDFGLAPGDRLALVMKNCPQYIELCYAAWHAGLVAVPVNAKLHASEFAYILQHSGARACFVTPDLADTIASLVDEIAGLERVFEVSGNDYRALRQGDPIALVERSHGDLAWLFYTSGTTGRPKGAMLTHGNLRAAVYTYAIDVDRIDPADCILHAAPLSHGSGLYGVPHLAYGANQVMPLSGGFDPAEIVDLLSHYHGAAFFAAPTMVKRLVDYIEPRGDVDLRGLKTIMYGGGPMYVADCQRALAVLGDKLVQIYGQGESPMTITALSREMHGARDHPRFLERLASVGVAQAVVEVRVADDEDNALPAGQVGEVLVRGDTVMRGYWNDPEASARTLRGGWLHTGDMGSFDDDGFLTLKDRSKDMIISGGSNIYPREVEEALLRHPDVAEASVIGSPHPDWGEAVLAFVVPVPGKSPGAAALDELCLNSIARFKRPREYRFVEQLPKNNYGKVLKTALRDMLARQDEPD